MIKLKILMIFLIIRVLANHVAIRDPSETNQCGMLDRRPSCFVRDTSEFIKNVIIVIIHIGKIRLWGEVTRVG